MRRGLAGLGMCLGLVVVAASGCDGGTTGLAWRLRLDAEARANARAVVAEIRQGSCAGTTAYRESLRIAASQEATSMTPSPPTLGRGRWAFAGIALDAECRPVARGCVEVELPGPSELEVHLEPVDEGLPECPVGRCRDGTCAANDPSSDAGLDGGVPDGCRAVAEMCNEVDDDCDGLVDEDFDLQTSGVHCGGCGQACEDAPRGTTACTNGSCSLECDFGWEDCNDDAADGCEANLVSTRHCGRCGASCPSDRPLCLLDSEGARCVAECDPGLEACDGACVDTSENVAHCGSCNDPCPDRARSSSFCEASRCGLRCDDGYGNCDENEANGCEERLTSLQHCQACNTTCARDNGTASCATGTCELIACDEGHRDCDGNPADGCEPLRTFYRDIDQDSFGDRSSPSSPACDAPDGYVDNDRDCDDGDGDVNPNATDVCNGIDDDCDGTADTSFECAAGTTESCSASTCPGSEGERTCHAGCGWGPCFLAEQCNGDDDDCDPWVDENTGDACGETCGTPRAVTPPLTYRGTNCGTSNDFNLECSGSTSSGDEVFVVTLDDSSGLVVTLHSDGEEEDLALAYLGTSCGVPELECQLRGGQITLQAPVSGDHYFAVEGDSTSDCGPYELVFTVP